MIGLMMTTKLPFLFGGDASLMVSPRSSYYLYNQHITAANLTSASNITKLVNNSSTALVNGSALLGGGLSVAQQTMLKAIIQPPPDKMNHFYGVLAAMSSLVFASAVFIFIRKAKGTFLKILIIFLIKFIFVGAHHAVIMFNFGWVAIIETTIITTVFEGFSLPASPFEWYLIVILGVFSFCGQILLTRSLQLEQAGPVSVVRATTDIALAFLWQVLIFKETPDLWSIFGALLVSSCILLTSLRKWVLSLPERSKLREKLFFLSLWCWTSGKEFRFREGRWRFLDFNTTNSDHSNFNFILLKHVIFIFYQLVIFCRWLYLSQRPLFVMTSWSTHLNTPIFSALLPSTYYNIFCWPLSYVVNFFWVNGNWFFHCDFVSCLFEPKDNFYVVSYLLVGHTHIKSFWDDSLPHRQTLSFT